MKKILPVLLTAVFLVTFSLPVYAAAAPTQKEEVVYGILNLDGNVDHIYVVNSFNSGKITDYGDYTKIENLTTADELQQNGDEITADTGAAKLYYQGTLKSKDLPWNIAVHYFLDGKELPGEDLSGKSGALQIKISVTQNAAENPTFFENYALQISLQLDTDLCEQIETSGATVADAGSAKQLNYTVLPGNGAEISVTADVHDFEMDAITINGIRLALDLSFDDSGFTDQIAQLTDAIRQLDSGAGSLLDGVNQLSEGMAQYMSGLKAFRDGLSQLGSGADSLNTGAASLRDGLTELSRQNDTLVKGALAIQQSTFDAVNNQISQMGLPVLTPDNYSAILANLPELAAVKAQLDGAVQFTAGLKGYTAGVSQLGTGASALADGTAQLKGSLSSIPSSAGELYAAGAELNSAVKALRDGLASYKGGTGELKSKTANLSADVSEKLSSILNGVSGNGDKVTSFVSDQDTNISAVQFVLKTGAIEQKEPDHSDVSQTARLSFWQKLMELFGWE